MPGDVSGVCRYSSSLWVNTDVVSHIRLRSLFPEQCSEGWLPAAGAQECRERHLYPAKPKSFSDPDYDRKVRLSCG